MEWIPTVTPVAAHYGAHLADPAPFYSTFIGRGSGNPVQFHVLLECDGPEPEARCAAALAALQRRLTNLGATSLTTAINGAFQACHQELSAPSGPGVGVTLLATRGEEAFLTAVADIAVFQLDRAGVRPVRPSVPGTMAAAMGNLPEISPAMERLDLQPGETVLICGSAISAAANLDGLEAVLSSSPRAASDSLASLMSNAALFLGLILVSPAE